MLKVTIALHPHGDATYAVKIAELDLIPDGNYHAESMTDSFTVRERLPNSRTARVERHFLPTGDLHLLRLAIEALEAEEE